VTDAADSLYFTAVARISRREDRLEVWEDEGITLHRYGLEFIHALNPIILEAIRRNSSPCTACGTPGATIPDLAEAGRIYCVLCQLRKACQNLLAQETLDPSA